MADNKGFPSRPRAPGRMLDPAKSPALAFDPSLIPRARGNLLRLARAARPYPGGDSGARGDGREA